MVRRYRWLAVLVLAALAAAGCGGGGQTAPSGAPEAPAAGQAAGDPQVPGLVVLRSDAPVPETVARVEEGLREVGMVAATLDHAANAAKVGERLRPTTLVIGGNPRAGTPVMAQQGDVAVDLPLKFLVWQAEDGVTRVGYNDPRYVAKLAGMLDGEEVEGLRQGAAAIADAAGGGAPSVPPGVPASAPAVPDGYLAIVDSDADVARTIERLRAALDAKELTPLAVVDHAQAAQSVGMELRPTRVLFVGDPQAGTRLLQQRQTMGIDLPLRFLVVQGEDGGVEVAYPDIRRLAERHGIIGPSELLDQIAQSQASFADAAAGRR